MPEEGNPPITTGVKEHLLQYTTYEVTMPQASAEKEFLFEIYFSGMPTRGSFLCSRLCGQ